MKRPTLFVTIPAMDEWQDLPVTMQDLTNQTCNYPWQIYVCINQPEAYWNQPEKHEICVHNQLLLHYLQQYTDQQLQILDYASRGRGWEGKKSGVGWARKVMYDRILSVANPSDIIISLDADTRVKPSYLQSVADNMLQHPSVPAISVPYYHPLTGNDAQDRAILRYEIYMRNYAINLYKVGSPYAFTALGSAIAMRAGALKKIGGITPLKSGEDFYLMQKFCKMSKIGNWNDEWVYPASRLSTRVDFGTGPAMIKGTQGDWQSYPIYAHHLFDSLFETYQQLPTLYHQEVNTHFLEFLKLQFKNTQLWTTIRKNVKDYAHFEHAFHEKADGLRIRQYLRQQHLTHPLPDYQALYENLAHWGLLRGSLANLCNTPLEQLSVTQLDEIRNVLLQKENEHRKLNQ